VSCGVERIRGHADPRGTLKDLLADGAYGGSRVGEAPARWRATGTDSARGGAVMTRCVVHKSCTNARQWGRTGADQTRGRDCHRELSTGRIRMASDGSGR
jgi:hypothetical protein